MLAAMVVIGAAAFELQNYRIGHSAFVLAYAMLFGLAAVRFAKRQGKLPETFAMIGVGVLCAMMAAVINALGAFDLVNSGWVIAGKRGLTEGMTLLLVLGVGGFLGPRLLGFERLPMVQIGGVDTLPKGRLLPRSPAYLYLIAGLAIVASILLQYVAGIEWMAYVRALVATAVIAATLEPWRLPAVRTTLSWCVWTANLLTILGLWLVAFAPKYAVDFLHILFIGGFSLLILAVGMRVTLSHGGHGLATEKRNWPLRIGLITGSVAMLARVGAPFSPNTYSEHLAMAAVLWLIGLSIWGWRLVRLITKRY
jgi:hypothetical protein